MALSKSVKNTIKTLHLRTTGKYYNWSIGDKLRGSKIAAWWPPGRALLANGEIYYLKRKPSK